MPEGLEKDPAAEEYHVPGRPAVAGGRHAGAPVGVEANFWAGQIQTRYKRTAPDVRLYGETPGSFPARNWIVQDGRGLADADVDGARDVCVLGNSLASTIFPTASVVGEQVKIDGMNYTVIGVLYPKGGKLGGDQDNFAVIPSPPVSTGSATSGARDPSGPGPRPRELRRLRRGSARPAAHFPQGVARRAGQL